MLRNLLSGRFRPGHEALNLTERNQTYRTALDSIATQCAHPACAHAPTSRSIKTDKSSMKSVAAITFSSHHRIVRALQESHNVINQVGEIHEETETSFAEDF